MQWNGLPLVIFGSGGISSEVATLIDDINNESPNKHFNLLGFIEQDGFDTKLTSKNIVATDSTFKQYASQFSLLGVIIPNGFPHIKKQIFEMVSDIGNIVFPNVIHPKASINTSNIELGHGNIITSGVCFTTNIKIGNFNLFNLNCTVGHDSIIEDFGVFNPLAAISGGVHIKEEVLVGTGATILQNLEIGSKSTVGAGAVVTKNVASNVTVVGAPARAIKLKE